MEPFPYKMVGNSNEAHTEGQQVGEILPISQLTACSSQTGHQAAMNSRASEDELTYHVCTCAIVC